MSGSHGPLDFPFAEGDHIAVRVSVPPVFAPEGSDLWFGGELTSRGGGGFIVTHPTGMIMWVPWDTGPVRSIGDDEWAGMLADAQGGDDS